MRKSTLPKFTKVPASAVFYALSDPVRLEIVKCLLEKGEVSCGEFKVSVSKSTMSHHFKVLREAGLIQKREEGTKQFNSLRKKEIETRFPGLLEMLTTLNGPV